MRIRELSRSRWCLAAAFVALAGLVRPPQAAAQAEVLAILGALKEAYEGYKDLNEVLTSNEPSKEDQISDKLTTLESEYKEAKKELDIVNDKVDLAIKVERQIDFHQTRQHIEDVRSEADTAVEQIALWKEHGKTDQFLLDQALDHSLSAANNMFEGRDFFLRPGNGDDDWVFEYRAALPAYLYVLTVRKGVLAIGEPDFRSDPVIQAEFAKHVARLDEIMASMDGAIQCKTDGSQPPPDPAGLYDLCSYCSDTITGAISAIDNGVSSTLEHVCEPQVNGSPQDYSDGSGFLQFYDRFRIQQQTGWVDLRNLRDLVDVDAHPSGGVEVIHHYNALIGYGGQCLTSVGPPLKEPVMQPCDGSLAQDWQRDSYGALRSTNGCLEVYRFSTENGARLTLDDCSRAPGERWTLTAAGEVRGIGNKCLDVKDFSTAPGAAVQMYDCWGGPVQQWSLAAPPGPSITSIDRTSGPISGGTYVHITGTGFDPSAPGDNNMQAFFGDAPSDYFWCEDATRCTLRSPAVTGPGPVLVRVKVGGVFSTEAILFNYDAYPALVGIDWYWSNTSISVSLDGYAPAGGTTVALGVSDPAAVGLPSSVTVPAGFASASVPVQLLPIASPETVTVTASYGGVSLSTSFDVAAWPALSLDLGGSDYLDAGASATASVSLHAAAPAGGAVVALVSSDASAIPVPASVTIAPGQKTATFAITNYYSGLAEHVTITAGYGSATASNGLWVPEEPGCRPHKCPLGYYFDPDSCSCMAE